MQQQAKPIAKKRFPRVLLILVISLGVAGSGFWYSDYRRFHDGRDVVTVPPLERSQPARRPARVEPVPTNDEFAANKKDSSPFTASQPSDAPPSQTVLDAQRLIESGEPAAAANLLEEYLKSHPDDTQALMELAMIHVLDLKNNDRAKQLLERIVQLDGSHRSALNELVNIYADPSRMDQGLQFLQSQIDQSSDPSELHYAYARLLSMSGRTDEAMTHYDQAKGLKDIQDQVYVDAAQAAIQTGNYERAFDNYRNALRLQEDELARAREQGLDSSSFVEDRIFATKIDWARMLIRTGRVGQARTILDGITGRDEDPNMISLRTEMSTTAQM